jgi:hypothetical protein
MIRIESAEAGIKTSGQVGNRKLAVSPLVQNLVKLTYSPALKDAVQKGDNTYPCVEPENIRDASMVKGLSGLPEHEEELARLVTQGKKGVEGVIDLISNVINPLCSEVKQHILNLFDADRVYPEVVSVDTLDFSAVPVLEQMLADQDKKGQYNQSPTLPQQINDELKSFSACSKSEILGLISTGNAPIDRWVGETLDGYLEKVLGTEMMDFGIGYRKAPVQEQLIQWLFANRLIENPPESLGMALSDFRYQVTTYRNAMAKLLTMSIADHVRREKAGGLFITPPKSQLTDMAIYVCKSTYLKWVKDGGSVEKLYGVVISGNSLKPAKELTSHDFYQRMFDNWEDKKMRETAAQFSAHAQEKALVSFTREAADKSDALTPRAAEERLKTTIRTLPVVTSENIDIWLRRLYVQAFYPHTGAMQFIENTIEVSQRRPQATMPQVLEEATELYIADWLKSLVVPCQSTPSNT